MRHFTLLLLIFVSCTSSKFSKTDIKRAQKLAGVEFSRSEISTMHEYLQRNLDGYKEARTKSLANDVSPAVYFNPLPYGFKIESEQKQNDFQLNKSVEMPDNFNDLAFYSVADLSVLIREQKVTSTQLTQLYIERIKKYDGQLESVITITEDLALRQAKKADEEIAAGNYKGPLHGIPYGVKDLLTVEGYPTTWGAAPYKNQMLTGTATIVNKLEEAGAVLIAKLVSGTLARGDVWFGGKTKNPWDLKQGASGSSAGSGSATSAGLVGFSIGTETLGSITSPSTRCGITGLRPTYGRVSRAGVMTLSWSMDKVGPMCRTSKDCALVFEVIHGSDSRDASAVQAAFNYSTDISDLKVAYFKNLFDEDTTTVGDNNRSALEMLAEMGIEMDSISLPESPSYSTFDVILRSEAGAFFDELVISGEHTDLTEQDERSRANSLRQSRFVPAVEYIQANRHRRLLMEEFHNIIKEYDVIVTPTFGGSQLLITNLTGQPVISVPNGFDEEDHPTSISFLGNLYDEAKILAMAIAFQEATDFDEKHPPSFID